MNMNLFIPSIGTRQRNEKTSKNIYNISLHGICSEKKVLDFFLQS